MAACCTRAGLLQRAMASPCTPAPTARANGKMHGRSRTLADGLCGSVPRCTRGARATRAEPITPTIEWHFHRRRQSGTGVMVSPAAGLDAAPLRARQCAAEGPTCRASHVFLTEEWRAHRHKSRGAVCLLCSLVALFPPLLQGNRLASQHRAVQFLVPQLPLLVNPIGIPPARRRRQQPRFPPSAQPDRHPTSPPA